MFTRYKIRSNLYLRCSSASPSTHRSALLSSASKKTYLVSFFIIVDINTNMRSLATFVTLACLLCAELTPVASIPVSAATSISLREVPDSINVVGMSDILEARRHGDDNNSRFTYCTAESFFLTYPALSDDRGPSSSRGRLARRRHGGKALISLRDPLVCSH